MLQITHGKVDGCGRTFSFTSARILLCARAMTFEEVYGGSQIASGLCLNFILR